MVVFAGVLLAIVSFMVALVSAPEVSSVLLPPLQAARLITEHPSAAYRNFFMACKIFGY
jgi:hypothetical protein